MYKVTKDTQFAILGLGRFGLSIAKILYENDFDVLCCDNDPIIVHEVAQYATHVMEVDLNDEVAVNQIGLGNFDVVIIAVGEFETAVVTTMLAKEEGVPYVLVKADGLRQKKILERTGADLVVLPEKEIGDRIAYKFVTNDPMDYIYHSDLFDVLEMKPKAHWVGKSLVQLDLRHKEQMNVLAVVREDEPISVLDPEMKFEKNDTIIALKMQEI